MPRSKIIKGLKEAVRHARERNMAIEDFKIEVANDKPSSGMWHTGPNPSWVTVTHLPTMISARMLDTSQHKARDAAMACVEMMVEQSRCDKCSFPEALGKEPE